MTPRIVVTSGDPATGVVTIEEAPFVRAEVLNEVAVFPLPLPATVEVVEQACNRCDEFDMCRHPLTDCNEDGVVVLGTATLEAVYPFEIFSPAKNPDCPEAHADVVNGEVVIVSMEMDPDLYDALTHRGWVAYLTDWTPA